MNGTGIRQERETIINMNEEDDACSIWTASETVYRRLMKRLGSAYLAENGERHALFIFPKKWLLLPRSRPDRPKATPKGNQFVKRAQD